jgi:hypothetical protein
MLASVSHHSLCGPSPVTSAQARSPRGGVAVTSGAIESVMCPAAVGTTPGWAIAARLVPVSGAELVSALCGVVVELSAQVVVQVAGRAGNAKAVENADVSDLGIGGVTGGVKGRLLLRRPSHFLPVAGRLSGCC